MPVELDRCTVICDAIGPDCPMGWRGEAEAGCWTGRCIPESACTFAPPVMP